MADVKDILNINKATPSKVEDILSGKRRTPTGPAKKKKPDGVSREVFALQESALLGVGPAPTAPPTQAPVFKEKRTIAEQKVNWQWKGFRNSARSDGAIFQHWIKTDDKSEDYKFARYNRKLKLQTYTKDEYEKHFQDPNWTKEETDQLFELCRQFDLRFVVIADRFESATPRSVEDLKERFYSITTKLITLHKFPDEDLAANPLANYSFNKKQEEERKRQSSNLFSRTTAQVAEEAELIEQFRRIDTEMKKQNKAKKRIATLMQYALTSSTATGTETPSTPAAESFFTPPPKTKKRKAHPDEDDEYEPEHGDEPHEKEKEKRKRGDRSVEKSRSFVSTPLTMGSKTAYRVDAAMVEMGILRDDAPPVQAQSVTKAMNDLRQDIIILLDLQKYIPQKEFQLEVLKAHKESLVREMTARRIPLPLPSQMLEKGNLAASSSNIFGLASLGDTEESEASLLGFDDIAPPPSRVRRDKEHKRVKKQKILDS